MNINNWTLQLAALGVISLTSIIRSNEKQCKEISLQSALAEPRKEIDELDQVLVLILLQRSRIVARIGEIKAQKQTDGQLNVRDFKREAEKMTRIKELCVMHNATEFETTAIETCMRGIIDVSVQLQRPVDLSPFTNFNCPSCSLRTAGLRNNPLKWPTCPSCGRQLTIKA